MRRAAQEERSKELRDTFRATSKKSDNLKENSPPQFRACSHRVQEVLQAGLLRDPDPIESPSPSAPAVRLPRATRLTKTKPWTASSRLQGQAPRPSRLGRKGPQGPAKTTAQAGPSLSALNLLSISEAASGKGAPGPPSISARPAGISPQGASTPCNQQAAPQSPTLVQAPVSIFRSAQQPLLSHQAGSSQPGARAQHQPALYIAPAAGSPVLHSEPVVASQKPLGISGSRYHPVSSSAVFFGADDQSCHARIAAAEPSCQSPFLTVQQPLEYHCPARLLLSSFLPAFTPAPADGALPVSDSGHKHVAGLQGCDHIGHAIGDRSLIVQGASTLGTPSRRQARPSQSPCKGPASPSRRKGVHWKALRTDETPQASAHASPGQNSPPASKGCSKWASLKELSPGGPEETVILDLRGISRGAATRVTTSHRPAAHRTEHLRKSSQEPASVISKLPSPPTPLSCESGTTEGSSSPSPTDSRAARSRSSCQGATCEGLSAPSPADSKGTHSRSSSHGATTEGSGPVSPDEADRAGSGTSSGAATPSCLGQRTPVTPPAPMSCCTPGVRSEGPETPLSTGWAFWLWHAEQGL